MPGRRQEKISRFIKEVVSDAITNRLNDPRIEGFVSVTRVDISPDLRNSDVYLSVFGVDEATQDKTLQAITHARNRIQSILASKLRIRHCPVLRLLKDEKFKKTLETMNLIDKAASEYKEEDEGEEEINDEEKE